MTPNIISLILRALAHIIYIQSFGIGVVNKDKTDILITELVKAANTIKDSK